MNFAYPCDQETIKRVLPHRDPFLWVTRIVACDEGKTVEAELDVSPDLPLFEGHFPEYPVLPGVIIMEALAQAASFCILAERNAEGALGFVAGIDNAKFRNQVKPGDTLTLKATIVKSSRRLCVADVEAWVGDTLCASATQKYVLAPAAASETSEETQG